MDGKSTSPAPTATDERTEPTPAYTKPPWWLRHIVSRVVPLIFRDQAVILTVRGRKSGLQRRTTLVILRYEGERYLITPYGNADWVRNLRAAGGGSLRQHGRDEKFTVVEVPVDEREPLLDAYLKEFGTRPTVASTWAGLPDPADHPTFRIVGSSSS